MRYRVEKLSKDQLPLENDGEGQLVVFLNCLGFLVSQGFTLSSFDINGKFDANGLSLTSGSSDVPIETIVTELSGLNGRHDEEKSVSYRRSALDEGRYFLNPTLLGSNKVFSPHQSHPIEATLQKERYTVRLFVSDQARTSKAYPLNLMFDVVRRMRRSHTNTESEPTSSTFDVSDQEVFRMGYSLAFEGTEFDWSAEEFEGYRSGLEGNLHSRRNYRHSLSEIPLTAKPLEEIPIGTVVGNAFVCNEVGGCSQPFEELSDQYHCQTHPEIMYHQDCNPALQCSVLGCPTPTLIQYAKPTGQIEVALGRTTESTRKQKNTAKERA